MRKPEPWVHVVLEASHGADPVAGEGEDEHAGAVADAIGTAEVGAEGWLAVSSRRDEVESPAWAEDAGAEAGDDISPLVFEGHGWHRHEDVVGEQGDDGVEVRGLVGVDERGDEGSFGG